MNETKPSNKDLFYKRLMWDYDIPAQDVRAVLWGEKDKAGHYDAQGLFKKAIESYSWFIILDLIPLPRIKELLTDFDLTTLRDKKLVERYAFIKAQLEELV